MDGSSLPPWLDRARPLLALLLVLAPAYALGVIYFAGSPRTTDVGYSPTQPVAYSHALHAVLDDLRRHRGKCIVAAGPGHSAVKDHVATLNAWFGMVGQTA